MSLLTAIPFRKYPGTTEVLDRVQPVPGPLPNSVQARDVGEARALRRAFAWFGPAAIAAVTAETGKPLTGSQVDARFVDIAARLKGLEQELGRGSRRGFTTEEEPVIRALGEFAMTPLSDDPIVNIDRQVAAQILLPAEK